MRWYGLLLMADKKAEVEVRHGLQLQSLWRIPTAAVSYNSCSAAGAAAGPGLRPGRVHLVLLAG